MSRASAVMESIRKRLVSDKKQHIEVLMGSMVNGNKRMLCVKFLDLDAPKYWEYVEGILSDYCETLTEVKRTKTTLSASIGGYEMDV